MEQWHKPWALTGAWLGIMATIGFFLADYTSEIHGIYLAITWVAGVMVILGWNEV